MVFLIFPYQTSKWHQPWASRSGLHHSDIEKMKKQEFKKWVSVLSLNSAVWIGDPDIGDSDPEVFPFLSKGRQPLVHATCFAGHTCQAVSEGGPSAVQERYVDARSFACEAGAKACPLRCDARSRNDSSICMRRV
jgi:hypothetical protein